jgi:uncharacterized damage-inducible protein DinB
MSSLEPWLRGTEIEVPAVGRAILHALRLAEEDLHKWCGSLSDEQLNARSGDAPPVAFHIRHLSRSLDRLLTYAEGRSLDDEQIAQLETELETNATHDELFAELSAALADASVRLRVLAVKNLEEARFVGKKRLPTTLGGLLVHIADHTQRHVGQAITTSRLITFVENP